MTLTQGPIAVPAVLEKLPTLQVRLEVFLPGVPPVIGLCWKRMIKRKERIMIKTMGGEKIW